MLIVMDRSASQEDIQRVVAAIEAHGLTPHPIPGELRTAVGVTGNKGAVDTAAFENLPGVLEIIPVSHPYKLVSREFHPSDTVVPVGGVPVGGTRTIVIAGPCAVETLEQTVTIAKAVKERGADLLRGGAFKPRTSPYSFQGLGDKGLDILAAAREETGLPVVTEVLDTASVELVASKADCLQIGARNMQNFELLKAAGRTGKPVLLKRGMSATLEEFLLAAEYVMAEGNPNVILCERGVRTFSDFTRNTLDLAIIPAVKRISHLPILVDPSHGTGKRNKVIPMSRAAIAAGADGIAVEVHHKPEEALSDGPQALTPDMFADLMKQLRPIAEAVGRSL
ncbi:MAG: 3-deoxy-7-phosphoheptulonate synthase [Acidobacteria bacterium]|nr:3-deoxy-7-phosphoheptulonate synthase [Acidobacteriota bacterium]MCG3193377.1 Phospho-2-dehydro-3-deoxyheptonate aldolase [Thermoanaerobaculia bacterium]MCK6685909.1 3-deoxy-7-phosphoheptulonate synthase [Thermoanaerobaculia bacterium]